MPLPVFAETVSTGTSRSCDKPFAERGLHAVEQRGCIFRHVPLVERDDQRAAFLDHLRGNPQILGLQPARRIQQQDDDFGIIDRPRGVGGR